MEEPETWRWIWLIAMAVFAGGEMLVAGSFFLAPFAVGAAVATICALAGTELWVQWLAFVGISFGAFLAMRPLARRVDKVPETQGIGANRLVGLAGTVVEEIPAGHHLGLVQVDREEWRAESHDGHPIPAGFRVRVQSVQGTRVVVAPDTP